jgi:hypothetical protein
MNDKNGTSGVEFLSDDDTALLRLIRTHPGVDARRVPSFLRPSLPRLERLNLLRYDDEGGGWYPAQNGGRRP